jgi:hypothetical protein
MEGVFPYLRSIFPVCLCVTSSNRLRKVLSWHGSPCRLLFATPSVSGRGDMVRTYCMGHGLPSFARRYGRIVQRRVCPIGRGTLAARSIGDTHALG